MAPRTMNQRNLCKAFVALAFAASAGPLQKLAAAQAPLEPAYPAQRWKSEDEGHEKWVVCVSKREDRWEPLTYLTAPRHTHHLDGHI
jgi:hypothetical protein